MASRDKRRSDIAKFLKVYRDFGAPPGEAAHQALWVILARHGTSDGATRALKSLWRRYVNINELRVAKASHIAMLIQRNVRNDAMDVAELVRGFLRRFHKDHHSIEFGVTEALTADQLRKYLANAEGHVKEMALALFIYYCSKEIALEEPEAAETDGKPKKRPEKEVTLAADRLRMLAATAAKGVVVAKTKQAVASRGLARAWHYAPLPVAKPAKKKVVKKAAPTPAPAQKPAAAARGGGTARPRTTRASRTRRTVKKSSRR